MPVRKTCLLPTDCKFQRSVTSVIYASEIGFLDGRGTVSENNENVAKEFYEPFVIILRV